MRSATVVTASRDLWRSAAPLHWPPLGELRAVLMAAAAAEAAEAASGEWEAPARLLRALAWLGQEFMSDWEAQDLRAALFQLLLLWLLVSLLGIQVAWRIYGNTVTGLYYRQGRCRSPSPCWARCCLCPVGIATHTLLCLPARGSRLSAQTCACRLLVISKGVCVLYIWPSPPHHRSLWVAETYGESTLCGNRTWWDSGAPSPF